MPAAFRAATPLAPRRHPSAQCRFLLPRSARLPCRHRNRGAPGKLVRRTTFC